MEGYGEIRGEEKVLVLMVDYYIGILIGCLSYD